MEKLVQSYLSDNYEINHSDRYWHSEITYTGHGIYPIGDIGFIYPNRLLSDLNTIFAIAEEELKTIIESWGHSIVEDLDLTKWWKENDYLLDLIAMPIVRSVAAQTIGLDLVSVQPLGGPIGELMYMDYRYGDFIPETTTPQINGRVYDEEVIQVAAHPTFGELEHPTPNIEININDRDEDSAVYRALQKWSNIIGISSRRTEE